MYGRVWGGVRVGCRVGYGEGSVGWGTCGVEVGKETTFMYQMDLGGECERFACAEARTRSQ